MLRNMTISCSHTTVTGSQLLGRALGRPLVCTSRPSSCVRPRQSASTQAALSRFATGPLSPPSKPSSNSSSNTFVPIIDKIAACVEANDSVHRFETIAGRSAMIGFAVACVAELILPSGGLFGSFSEAQFSTYSTLALLAVCFSVVFATLKKHRIGGPVKEAVLTSLTALSRSKSSLSSIDVDSAVDFVFDSVFSREVIASMFTEDEWI